ncbi:hypothetical protein NQ317_010681 [Molorchus minor]|uniref:Uncharacterized protein n=1 Tax=Molorchus minor TaxID=1323400 RepID=A0ABQ9K6I4_9CUCU|nr:hypothetical protein NQ317_010681 [Molorchus minor]
MNNTLTKESVILNTEAGCAKRNLNEKKTLLEAGTSPCTFTSNMSYKLNNAHKSPQRTSVGTSPIIFKIYSPLKRNASPINQVKGKKINIPTKSPATVVNKHVERTRRTEIVDKGTSPIFENYTDNLGFGKDALLDNEKRETFNRLLLKMSCKFLDSPNTPIIEDNGTCLTRSRRAQTFNRNITQPTECNAEAAPVRRINREVQTSQQTQTTSSVDNILKTYRRKRNPRRQAVRHDMSDGSTTDESDILREFDKGHMERKKCPNVLFKSLADVMLPSFSSSDEEMMHINSENLPWRLDGDLVSVPRRSSYKLSFLRSAWEIEMERSRKTVVNKDSSDSETDMKIRNTDKHRKSSPKKNCSRKVYEEEQIAISQENCENKATNESPTDEERSCSNSVVSAVRFSEPETEDDVVCQKVINVISDVRLPPLPSTNVVKNPVENINSSLPLTTKNLKEHDRSANKMDKSDDRLCYQDLGNIQPVAAVAKSVRSDSIHGDDSEILALPLDNSDEERLIEDNAKKKSGLQEFVEHSLVNNVQPEEKIDAKASPKKTRLEASTTKQNIRSTSSDNQPEEVNFKVPKKRDRKPKKQIDMENDDGVSSTTVESHEVFEDLPEKEDHVKQGFVELLPLTANMILNILMAYLKQHPGSMKRQSLKRDSDESDLEDSQVVEERLKNLLSTNRRRLNKPKNIFDDVVGDVPKLRQSIIARALKKVVCSTPMPTQKQKRFLSF